jgi:hypothetical protein
MTPLRHLAFVIAVTVIAALAAVAPSHSQSAAATAQTTAANTNTAAANSGSNTGNTGNCTYATLTVADSTLSQGIQGILNLVCSYHTAASKMITQMAPNANAQMQSSDKSSVAVSVLVKLFALFVTIMITYGLVVLTLQVVEIAIRLTIYSVLMPFIVYSYIYDSTRYLFDNAVKGYLFVLFKFAFLGVFIAASLLMLQIASQAVGNAATALSTVITDLTNTQAIVQVISFAVAAVASTLMTSRLMGSATNAAAAITSYEYANSGIATSAMGALNTGLSVGIGAAGILAYGAVALVGADTRLAGRALSAVFSRNRRLAPFGQKLEGVLAAGGTLVAGKAIFDLYNSVTATSGTTPLTSHDAPSDAQRIQSLTPPIPGAPSAPAASAIPMPATDR